MAQQAAFCSPLDSQISAALTPHHRRFLSQWMMVDRDAQLVKEQRISDPGVVSPKWDIYSTRSFSKSSVSIMGEEAEGLKLRKTTAKWPLGHSRGHCTHELKLWLAKQDLHVIKPVNSLAWMVEGSPKA